ncbi:MAG: hypothetical protein SGBAC_007983 [Bacillariaceae sp.]
MITIKHARLILIVTLLLLASSATLAQEDCRDTDWVDEDGCGCDEYTANEPWCDLYGEFVFEGESAYSACCICGGGIAIEIESTDPPIVIGEKNCILSPPVEVAPGLTVENWIDNDGLMFRMRLVYEGTAWLGLSFENDGTPGKPEFAVIGRMEDDLGRIFGDVKKYMLTNANPDASGVAEMSSGSQTLEDVVFSQTTASTTGKSKTIMAFSKATNEIFDFPQQVVTDRSTWIFAVGLPNNQWGGVHTIHGKFNLALSPCFTNPWEISNPSVNGGLVDGNALDRRRFFGEKENRFLWVAHGISLAIAWGIIAPLALATTFWKQQQQQQQQPSKWSKLNQFFTTTTLLLTCAGILLGVVATYLDEEVGHLRTDHSYFGVGVFGGLLLYSMLTLYFGAKRAQEEKGAAAASARRRQQQPQSPPREPRSSWAARKRIRNTYSPEDREVMLGMEDGMGMPPPESSPTTHGGSNSNKYYHDANATTTLPPQQTTRLEWFSRLLFLVCIGVAYYTCQTGLDWQLVHFELEWEQYYWGAGAIGAIILLVLVPLSFFGFPLKDSRGGGDKNDDYSSSPYYSNPQHSTSNSKMVSLGAQDSMMGSTVEQRTPHSQNPYDGNPYLPPMFPMAVQQEEDTFFPPTMNGGADSNNYNNYNKSKSNLNHNVSINTQHQKQLSPQEHQLQYLEDDDAQRSPMRASWDLDCCKL